MVKSNLTLRVLKLFLDNPKDEIFMSQVSSSLGKKNGSIDVILKRLEVDSWLTSYLEDINEKEMGRRKRRYYSLTELGKQEASLLIEQEKKVWNSRMKIK